MAEGEGAPHSAGVLRELLAVFSFGVDDKELKKGESALSEFFGKVKQIAGAVAEAFAIHEIFEFGEATARAMSGIEHQAAVLGVSTEKIQEWRFAAQGMSEDADALVRAASRMQVTQQSAAAGNETAAKAFADLGVKTRDASGHMKTADVLLLDVADGIAKEKDASKQAALATAVFGRSGRELLPILKQGRAGLEGVAEEYKELGGGYTEAAMEQGKKFEKQQARLNLTLTGLRNTVALALLPALTKIVQVVVSGVKWFGDLAKGSNIVNAVLLVMAAAMTKFALSLILANLPLVGMVLALGALFLLVDEIITLFQGGDTLIGKAIDSMFGKGASTAFVEKVRDIYKEIRDYILQAWGAWKEWTGAGKQAEGGKNRKEIQADVDRQTISVARQRSAQNLPLTDKEVDALHRGGLDPDAFRERWSKKGGAELSWFDEKKPPPMPTPYGPSAPVMIDLGGIEINLSNVAATDPGSYGRTLGEQVAAVLRSKLREAATTLQRKPGT